MSTHSSPAQQLFRELGRSFNPHRTTCSSLHRALNVSYSDGLGCSKEERQDEQCWLSDPHRQGGTRAVPGSALAVLRL